MSRATDDRIINDELRRLAYGRYYAKARSRATARLIKMHRRQFNRLLTEELDAGRADYQRDLAAS